VFRIRDRCFSETGIQYPGWKKNPDPGSRMNTSDLILRAYYQCFGLKILKCFDADPDPDPESRKEKLGSGISIPDPLHLVPTRKAAGLKSNNV
jgi:hypothetical protein